MIALRYVVFPRIDSYREDIAASLSRASGMAVALSDVDAGWQGLRPLLTLTGVRVADAKGQPVLELPRVDITLSWWTLLAGDLRFQDVDFQSPALRLRRGADGLVYLADKPLNAGPQEEDGRFAAWLLDQPRLHVHDATLSWRDELAGAPEVVLTRVDIVMRKAGRRHRAALNAVPPPAISGKVDIRADVAIERAGGAWRVGGTLYAETGHADIGRLREHLPVPATLRSARGAFRLWLDVADGRLTDVTADVDLRGVRAQLADDALPLELDALAGRAFYRAQAGGYTAGTRGLRFRTAGGMAAEAGEYTLTSVRAPGQPPTGEVRANGVDLKIAATLLDYLPVPRETKAQVIRFAPRGRLVDSSLVWTGESPAGASAFRLRSSFENLAINAVDGQPGATGLTGTIEGDERGGTITLKSRGATFEAGRVFRAPLALDELEAQASWTRGAEGLEVRIAQGRLANADGEVTVSGLWRSLPASPEASPGFVDLEGRILRGRAAAVANYLPNGIDGTRAWLERSVQAGELARGRYVLKGDLWHFPFRDGRNGRFLAEAGIEGGRLRYDPAWPPVESIRGDIRFENARMEIRAREAAIYGSRVRQASAIIPDLGASPPALAIEGDVETTGTDAVRFLRETPLAAGPGAFTRTVAVEGPARLLLRMHYPLWGPEPLRVNGEVTLAGATASVGRHLALANARGAIAFTEAAVSAPEIAGTIFGQPARLRLATEPDGSVLTQLEGRVAAPALSPFIPAAFARRMAGQADWRARVEVGVEGTLLKVESTLAGLAIGLPEPFAKRAEESRALAVTIRRLGAPDEDIVASLEGGVHARIARAATPAGERWRAALRFGAPVGAEPLREGLWLQGTLARFDLDAWRESLAAGPQAATPGAEAGLELRGMDLQIGRLRYTGRDFLQLQARLAREGGEWRGTLASPTIAGRIAFDPAGRGKINARLTRFVLDAGVAEDAGPQPAPTGVEDDLPELDIVAERFDFRGRWLGRLELLARPDGNDWRIDRLDIANGHARFASSGLWRRTATGPLTRLDLRLETSDLSALMGQFGYGEHVNRGEAKLEGQLLWPGYPYEFSTGALSGRFRVEASKGQFARIEPGAGKLLGLISLQSIPRRVTFDFRDIFSEGFAFDRIAGDVKLARGILLTSDFEIGGPSAFVSMAGEVSLPQETQHLTLRVVPEVGESVAIAATVLGTPVMGLTTLLLQKLLQNPLGKAVSYEYLVTGSWDNPSVTRLGAPAAGQAPKATAAPPATRTP